MTSMPTHDVAPVGVVERDEMLNGERFLDSLRDGREVWFDG